MVLHKLVPMLHLRQETEDEHKHLYLDSSACAKTPSPRPRPDCAPTQVINRPEEIPLLAEVLL